MPFKKQGSPYWQYDRTFSLKGKRYRVRGSTGESAKKRAEIVEEAELAGYIAKRRTTVANATVNREIQQLRRVFNYVKRNLKMAVAEFDGEVHIMPEPRGRVRALTLAEFCLLTGCRVGSAIRLEWRDVDLESQIVVFRNTNGGELQAAEIEDFKFHDYAIPPPAARPRRRDRGRANAARP